MNHSHAGDRDFKSLSDGVEIKLRAETINQPSEVKTINQSIKQRD